MMKEPSVHIEVRQERPNGPRMTTFRSLERFRLFLGKDLNKAVVEVSAADYLAEMLRIQEFGPRTPPATPFAPFSSTWLEEGAPPLVIDEATDKSNAPEAPPAEEPDGKYVPNPDFATTIEMKEGKFSGDMAGVEEAVVKEFDKSFNGDTSEADTIDKALARLSAHPSIDETLFQMEKAEAKQRAEDLDRLKGLERRIEEIEINNRLMSPVATNALDQARFDYGKALRATLIADFEAGQDNVDIADLLRYSGKAFDDALFRQNRTYRHQSRLGGETASDDVEEKEEADSAFNPSSSFPTMSEAAERLQRTLSSEQWGTSLEAIRIRVARLQEHIEEEHQPERETWASILSSDHPHESPTEEEGNAEETNEA